MTENKLVNGTRIKNDTLKELSNHDMGNFDRDFKLLKNLNSNVFGKPHKNLKSSVNDISGVSNTERNKDFLSILKPFKKKSIATTPLYKLPWVSRPELPISHTIAKNDFKDNITKFKIMENADYVKTIYYQIIERLCINAQIYFYLTEILSNFLELFADAGYWETTPIDEKKKIDKTLESFEELNELMKDYFIDLNDTATITPLSHIFSLANSANFYFYKKYCHQKDIYLPEGLKVKYNPISTIPYTYNEYNYNPSTDRFNNSVKDIYRIKYDTNIKLSDIDKDFNSIVAQPLYFREISGVRSNVLEVFNSQSLSNDSGIKDANSPDSVIENEGYLKNAGFSSSAQFEKDIYLPNFGNYKIPYSPGLIKNLKNINTKYNTDIINYSSISDPLPIDEQISQTEKLIERYTKCSIKRCIRINNKISIIKNTPGNDECGYIKILNKLFMKKVGESTGDNSYKFKKYSNIFIRINLLLTKFNLDGAKKMDDRVKNPFIKYIYLKKYNKLNHKVINSTSFEHIDYCPEEDDESDVDGEEQSKKNKETIQLTPLQEMESVTGVAVVPAAKVEPLQEPASAIVPAAKVEPLQEPATKAEPPQEPASAVASVVAPEATKAVSAAILPLKARTQNFELIPLYFDPTESQTNNCVIDIIKRKKPDRLFIFNDNVNDHHTNTKGGGNGQCRIFNNTVVDQKTLKLVAGYNNVVLPDTYFKLTKPASFGISTGWADNGFNSLSDTQNNEKAQNRINTELKELVNLLQTYQYTEIAYSATAAASTATPYPILGTGLFTVGDDVKKYIVCRLTELQRIWPTILNTPNPDWPLDSSPCPPSSTTARQAAIDAAPTNVLMEEKSLDLKPVPYWKDNKLYLITIKNFYNGMREKESIMEIWDDVAEQGFTSGVDDILTPVKLQQVWTNLLSLSKKMPADILDVLENPDNKPWPTHNASHVVKISLHGEQTSGHLSLDNQSKIITLLGPEFKGIVNNLKIQFIEESDVALKEGDTDSTWITLAIQYLYLNRTVQSGGTVLQSTTKLKRDYNFIIDPKTKKSIKSNSKRGEAIIMGYMRNSDSLFF